jgi:hypothetical protein
VTTGFVDTPATANDPSPGATAGTTGGTSDSFCGVTVVVVTAATDGTDVDDDATARPGVFESILSTADCPFATVAVGAWISTVKALGTDDVEVDAIVELGEVVGTVVEVVDELELVETVPIMKDNCGSTGILL